MNYRQSDIDSLIAFGYHLRQPWEIVDTFEKLIADFFGSRFAVATDCNTHALELCLRLYNEKTTELIIPSKTYMSVPMMLTKIDQPWRFEDYAWHNFYQLNPFNIIDAATLWKKDSYIKRTFTCLSFQFKKHLPIGRGGMILLDDEHSYNRLQKMVRDGRDRTLTQYHDDVEELGYHYYMTPEDAALGIRIFHQVRDKPSKAWSSDDYFDLRRMKVFKNK